MGRFITFRFDDGFIKGARKAAACLHPNAASFFVVTGLICGSESLDHIGLFRERDFGSIDEWRALAAEGHDVQLHSATHANFTAMSMDEQSREIRESLAVIRRIHAGPYAFCYPYNALTDLDLACYGISASGFETVASDHAVSFNLLDERLDMYRLRSWAVRERHFDDILNQLMHDVPEMSWTILAFHSLDDEGHEPWGSESFSQLVSAVRGMGYQILSVAAMVNMRILYRVEE